MTVTGVAFVPCAPLLVPEVAGGSSALDEQLRVAAGEACRELVGGADEIIVLAPSHRSGHWDQAAGWDFHGFGVTRRVTAGVQQLPWQLGIGAWLLDEVGYAAARRFVAVTDAAQSLPVIDDSTRTGLLVVGDGSARRSEKAPGHLDERAAGFDAAISAALVAGDAEALRTVNLSLADELMCAGAPVWRVAGRCLHGSRVVSAQLSYESAPYGVAYFVAQWLLSR